MPLEYGPPSTALQRELDEVSAKARALSEHVRAANFLPSNFPRSQLEGICRNLIGLPAGTSEGCCVPLTYARKRLPSIRREYVSARPDGAQDDKDSPPAILRGENLDQLLKDLLASVTTALDQYQVESDVDVADSVERETAVDSLGIPGIDAAASKALALEKSMGEASETVRDINQKNAQRVDNLARQYKDVEIQSGLASAELSMPEVRVSWYQPVVAQLRKMPEIIERTGKAIRVATDIARPLVQRWNDFKANAWSHVLHEIDETGKTLEQVGRRLRAARDDSSAPPRIEPSDAPPDFDPVKASDMIASGIAPPRSWIPWINHLDFRDKSVGIDKVEILRDLTALQTLRLNRVYLSSFEPFSHITSLQNLQIRGYWLQDIASITSLTNLSTLDIGNCRVRDISPLQSLHKLRSLHIDGTQVIDLESLRNLENLEALSMYKTSVQSLASLSSCRRLVDLDVSQTKITTLEPLADNTTLQRLVALNTAVSDIKCLAGLGSLRELNLEGTKVQSLEPLRSLGRLIKLSLGATQISNIEPLKTLTALEVVDLERTAISDLAPIKDLIKLRQLKLSGTSVSDIGPLSGLSNLKELSLIGTAIKDLTPLANLVRLEDLRLNSTGVRDLSPLANLKNLKMLQLDMTNVDDLSPIHGLQNLEELWIDHTPVRDLVPLSTMTKLRTIWINGTRVRDLSCLTQNAALEAIIVGSEARRKRLADTLPGRDKVVQVTAR
jgi:Leucine-rich repeat (LRR) protein